MVDQYVIVYGWAVGLSYVYAFVGGFTDAANAIATTVGTRVLAWDQPKFTSHPRSPLCLIVSRSPSASSPAPACCEARGRADPWSAGMLSPPGET